MRRRIGIAGVIRPGNLQLCYIARINLCKRGVFVGGKVTIPRSQPV
jgi:hypothetical protein